MNANNLEVHEAAKSYQDNLFEEMTARRSNNTHN